ncbi:winged helix-turn-helix domain-containing protein [Tunturiibacter lichenicola]|uniref:winged helix-turn-helix domain-containing protein n=1 Tax=Tunturiibacter lichenicola TaxID=2051959 RepID=UPI003D9B1F7C
MVYLFEHFELSEKDFCLHGKGERIALEPKALRVLLLLVSKAGHLVEKGYLLETVWNDTFVEENTLTRTILLLRRAIGDNRRDRILIETVPTKGYRFVAEVRQVPEEGDLAPVPAATLQQAGAMREVVAKSLEVERRLSHPAADIGADLQQPQSDLESGRTIVSPVEFAAKPSPRKRRWWISVAAAILVPAFAGGAVFLHKRKTHAIKETDTVVLADFANSTGNAVFDDTLKQALIVSLRQSPFLNILSDQKVIETLRLMTLPPNTVLTPKIASEVCQRAGSKAYIAGSVASIGDEYVIGLNAVNCQSGDTLALEQAHANGKEKVLDALDKVAAKLRNQLGESLTSVQRFDTPLEQATTSSFDALKAYSLGRKIWDQNGNLDAIPFFKQAIELDPNFAEAQASLGSAYAILGERAKSLEYFEKAFQLRNRATEPEKYDISSAYYDIVTGEIEKSIEICQLWTKSYPRDANAHFMSGYSYGLVGQDEKSLAETVESVRLDPDSSGGYFNLMQGYAYLNQLDKARAAYQEGIKRKPESSDLHANMYGVAFLERDKTEMELQANSAANEPGVADVLLSFQSDTEAFFGHLKKARDLSKRAVESATLNDLKETAAQWQMNEALREAEFGNPAHAQEQSASALILASTRDIQILAALAFARAGNSTRAQRLADEVHQQFPLDTIVGNYWLPTVQAAIEINRNNPSKAIEFLKAAAPYELAEVSNAEFGAYFYPVYVRGQAYLLLHQGADAAAEFQKFLAHPTGVANNPLFVLAHLGLARAYTLQGDTDKSRAAYLDFFTLWKDADQDIPVLKQAKAEYAKLQ